MSPRRTRAATAEQFAVSTRSKVQKINNANQDVARLAQKTRQSQKKPVKNNLEAAAKQSAKKGSPDAEVTFRKSVKKITRRRLNLDKGAETEDADRNMDSNESIRILKDRHCDNVMTVDLVKYDLLQLSASKDLDSEKMPNGKLQQKTFVKISPIVVTPKSTPPKLSLTPHRSKKTPKKSPISLGSPKTHSIAIPKLFKSPRKLSLADEDSEKTLEKSNSDSHAKKSRKKKKSERKKKSSLSSNSMSDKSVSMSPTKNKHKKSDINLIIHRFSKSPKIVLKSPKSKKSKSRKLKLLSTSRMKKSALKTSTSPETTPSLNSANSSKIHIKKSPLSKGKSLSSIKRRLLSPKLKKRLTASQIKDVLAEPIVLLEKLSPESLKRKNMLTIASKARSDTLIKVRSLSIRIESNPKILIPIKKVSANMSSKRNSSLKLRNSIVEESRISNINRISPRTKYNTSIQEKDTSIPLMSSTPRQEKMALMDTSLESNTSIASVNNTSLNARLRRRNQSNMQLSNIIDKNTDIENVSKFDKEIDDTSQSLFSNVTKRNVTYDKDNTMENKQENRNNTYELEQPQTLGLRQMIKKRTSTDANLSLKDNAKKAKVRFADVTSGSTRKSVDKLNGSRSNISHVSTQNRSNIMNSAHKSKKDNTSKLTGNSLISPFKKSSPRIHGGTPRIQFTPKTFASIEKKSEKKSSTKKVPNFGKIHEKMFAKSESLVDAKKRLEARHLAFIANKTISKNVKMEEKKPLPTDTRDGIHNRFGFKLKKTEATHIILKKQVVFSRQKQQHETRMMLKGVRTNRRFELQMKARNLNS